MLTAAPILYSFRRCPYAMRARLALVISSTPCQLREVLLRSKPASLLEASSKATVPVLVPPRGQVLDESLDIMLWALKRAEHTWLVPTHGDLGDALALIASNDGGFKFHLDRYKYADRHKGESELSQVEQRAVHQAAASSFLHDLNSRLSSQPWLLGDRASIADAAIAPFVRQFANTDRQWFDSQEWPHLLQWLEDFLASALFESIMPKFAPWCLGDPPILFGQDSKTDWQRSHR